MTVGGLLLLAGVLATLLTLRLLIKALARWEIATDFKTARRLGPWFFYSVILLPVIAFLLYILLNRE